MEVAMTPTAAAPGAVHDGHKYAADDSKPVSPYWSKLLRNGFMMHQSTSQCCRCCCTQPNIDWSVHSFKSLQSISLENDELGPTVFKVYESAGFWGRCLSHCYPGCRSTTYSVKSSDSDEDRVLIRHEKSQSCPMSVLLGYNEGGPARVPCCCYLPYLNTFDGITNEKLGSTKAICNAEPLCCPKFVVFDASDKPKYLLQPDLCWYNQCYDIKCDGEGAKCCYVPFYIRDYVSKEKMGDDEVAIIDLYIGLRHELCTKQNLYAVKFPETATDADKATLMGATLIYDVTLNEQTN